MTDVVPPRFRSAYNEMSSVLDLGKSYWESRLRAMLTAPPPVLIQARIKDVGSLYAKVQKGDYARLVDVEDLIACRVVFLHPSGVNAAVEVIRLVAPGVESKNIDAGKPLDFSYKQPHMIVKFPDDYVGRNPELMGVRTEIQLTTYIQHALQESVHDVIYKGKKFSWNEHRLDGRLRGLLEIVDDVLGNVSNVAQIGNEPTYDIFDKRNQIIAICRSIWPDGLPSDMRRFVITVEFLLNAAGVGAGDLAGIAQRNPDIVKALSLNTVDKVLGLLLRERFNEISKGLKSKKIFVPDELGLFVDVDKFPDSKRLEF